MVRRVARALMVMEFAELVGTAGAACALVGALRRINDIFNMSQEILYVGGFSLVTLGKLVSQASGFFFKG